MAINRLNLHNQEDNNNNGQKASPVNLGDHWTNRQQRHFRQTKILS